MDDRGFSSGLSNIRIPGATFDALVSGVLDGDVVRFLLASERGRRLLLLRYVLASCGENPSLLGPMGEVAPARTLLAAVEDASPDVLEAILREPQTGMWLADAVRFITAHSEEQKRWTAVGAVMGLAAAAGLRAGLTFEVPVPVERGRVMIPTLGRMTISPPEDEARVATLVAHRDHLVLVDGGRRIEVSYPLDSPRPNWNPVRTIEAVGPRGQRLLVRLDDIDPAPQKVGLPSSLELDGTAFNRWRDSLERAWMVLEKDHPGDASALATGLMAIMPLEGGEGPAAGSSGEGFGAASVSLPDSDADLACALLHEFMHSVLNGLLHLVRLSMPDLAGPVHYAPWRDDPRPLSAMLHGAYAFTAVTSFWSVRRESDVGAAGRRADLEFATWRLQTAAVLEELAASSRLTPLGKRMVNSLRARGADWSDRPVRPDAHRLARLAAASHRAAWRVHHVRIDRIWVEQAAQAWLAGGQAPAMTPAEERVVSDRSAHGLNRLHLLARSEFVGGQAADPYFGVRTYVGEAAVPDRLLVRGDPRGARDGYLAELLSDPYDPRPWSGLGSAVGDLPDDERPRGAELLTTVPERVRTVLLAVLAKAGEPPDLMELAAWLGAEA